MNDDIIRMAQKTGKTEWYRTHPDGTSDFICAEFTLEQLKHFAELVRAAGREGCAELCDQLSDSSRDLRFGAAIRARGNT
jgi:hypothetical protein